jgi:hypothetical protein
MNGGRSAMAGGQAQRGLLDPVGATRYLVQGPALTGW